MQAVLSRAEANLRAVGVAIEKMPREAGTGRRLLRIKFAEPIVTAAKNYKAHEDELHSIFSGQGVTL
jgi:hypothetical protein